MSMIKRTTLLLMILLLSVGVAAAQQTAVPLIGAWDTCPAPTNLPATVDIGLVADITGAISFYGAPQRDGIEMAVTEINALGYLGETTLNVIYEDTASDPTYTEAINAVTKLVEEDNVTAILGPTLSSEAFAAAPVAQENGTPILGLSNAAEGLPQTIGEYYFRALMPESTMIPFTVQAAQAFTGMERVAVLYGDDDDFTLSGYDAFVDALEAQGIDIIREETFARGDSDFNAQLTNILADEPDAIILAALAAEAVPIINQARTLGFTGSIIGGNGLNAPGIANGAGTNADGVIAGTSYHPTSTDPVSEAFTADFVEQYGYEPDQFAAHAYTGAWVMATAIRCADSAERDDVRDALTNIQNFASPLGSFGFDENRDPVYNRLLQEIRSGEFTVVVREDEL